MEFGLNFFPSCAPHEKSAEVYWADALHLCGLMDELGYTHVRTVEHYFHPYGGYSANRSCSLPRLSGRRRRRWSLVPCCRCSTIP